MVQGIYPLVRFVRDYRMWPRRKFLEHFVFPFFLYPGDREEGAPKIAFPREVEASPPRVKKGNTMVFRVQDLEETLPPSFRHVVAQKALLIPLPFRQEEKGVVVLEIGRSPDRDLYFEDEMVSAHHATIVGEGDPLQYFVIDQGSTNETYVNGVAIPPGEKIPLEDESTLEFGLHRLFIFYLPETVYKCTQFMED